MEYVIHNWILYINEQMSKSALITPRRGRDIFSSCAFVFMWEERGRNVCALRQKFVFCVHACVRVHMYMHACVCICGRECACVCARVWRFHYAVMGRGWGGEEGGWRARRRAGFHCCPSHDLELQACQGPPEQLSSVLEKAFECGLPRNHLCMPSTRLPSL